MENIKFDKEKFLNYCCGACRKSRQILIDKIEQYKSSEPEMVQYLEWYRARAWQSQVKSENFHKMLNERGEKQLNKDAAEALRAVANKLEESGMHFMIDCELPLMPIFSGKDHVEKYHSHIEVSLVSGPLGG